MEEKKTEQKEDDVRGAILVVSADVIEGREAEFNKWYDEHHIPLFSGKMPHLKRVRRFYSKRANPSFITIYEFETPDDLKRALSSSESKAAGEDADTVVGKLVRSFSYSTYSQIYPK